LNASRSTLHAKRVTNSALARHFRKGYTPV
jgi:hypothetical protein